jgi:hypothetical protein
VADISCKLGNEIQLSALPRGIAIWLVCESKCEGFVISPNVEMTSLNEVSKMFECQIDIQ